jgi:hypothetical protein
MKPRNGRCRHGMAVCSKCVVITDAARRICDQVNARITFTPWDQLVHSWMAFRLADGSTDGILYDSRDAAIKHQSDERLCAYFSFRQAMAGANPRDCQLFLDLHRNVYDNGGHLTEPKQPGLILSTYGHDVLTGRINPYA